MPTAITDSRRENFIRKLIKNPYPLTNKNFLLDIILGDDPALVITLYNHLQEINDSYNRYCLLCGFDAKPLRSLVFPPKNRSMFTALWSSSYQVSHILRAVTRQLQVTSATQEKRQRLSDVLEHILVNSDYYQVDSDPNELSETDLITIIDHYKIQQKTLSPENVIQFLRRTIKHNMNDSAFARYLEQFKQIDRTLLSTASFRENIVMLFRWATRHNRTDRLAALADACRDVHDSKLLYTELLNEYWHDKPVNDDTATFLIHNGGDINSPIHNGKSVLSSILQAFTIAAPPQYHQLESVVRYIHKATFLLEHAAINHLSQIENRQLDQSLSNIGKNLFKYRKKIPHAFANLQYLRGMLAEQEFGFTKKAENFYLEAATAGNVRACFKLAEKALADSKPEEAHEWYQLGRSQAPRTTILQDINQFILLIHHVDTADINIDSELDTLLDGVDLLSENVSGESCRFIADLYMNRLVRTGKNRISDPEYQNSLALLCCAYNKACTERYTMSQEVLKDIHPITRLTEKNQLITQIQQDFDHVMKVLFTQLQEEEQEQLGFNKELESRQKIVPKNPTDFYHVCLKLTRFHLSHGVLTTDDVARAKQWYKIACILISNAAGVAELATVTPETLRAVVEKELKNITAHTPPTINREEASIKDEQQPSEDFGLRIYH